jgi:hypothetical protein
MTEGYINGLLSFQIFLISRVKFSYFIIFSVSVLGKVMGQQTAISITSAVLFSLSISNISLYYYYYCCCCYYKFILIY